MNEIEVGHLEMFPHKKRCDRHYDGRKKDGFSFFFFIHCKEQGKLIKIERFPTI